MDRSNPLSTAVLGDISLGATAYEQEMAITRLIQDGQRADQSRTTWLAEQQRLARLRYGVRQPKNFPWPNASNLAIPFIDQIMRKFKPVFMRLVAEPDPVVEFRGEDPASSTRERRAEQVYQWLFKVKMNALEPLAYLLDIELQRGFAFMQVGWDYAREYECRVADAVNLFGPGFDQQPPDENTALQRILEEYDIAQDAQNQRSSKSLQDAARAFASGQRFAKISYLKVTRDIPALYERDPIQVITPPRCTDIEQAEWVIVQHLIPIRVLQAKESDGFFNPGTVSKILTDLRVEKEAREKGARNEVGLSPSLYSEQTAADAREKIWGSEDEDNLLIWEVFHWADHGDGVPARTVTYLHPRTKTKCRSMAYVYPFKAWPLVRFDFEKTSRRHNAPRGIPAMLEALQREINAQHNSRIDRMSITNAPCFQMPAVGNFKARTLQLAPGKILETPLGATITPLFQDRGAFPEMLTEENLIRSIGENYIGVFDAAITSPTSNTQARTATEIQAISQYTAATSTLDAILFQLAMRKLHTMIWQLWQEFGPEEIAIKVASTDPNSTEDETLVVKKADIAGQYTLVPTGTVANTNRAIEIGHAREAMGAFVNDLSGFINPYELRKWYFNLLDYRAARRILNPPQQAQELVTLRNAAAALEQDPAIQQQLGLGGAMAAPNEPEEQPLPETGGSAIT